MAINEKENETLSPMFLPSASAATLKKSHNHHNIHGHNYHQHHHHRHQTQNNSSNCDSPNTDSLNSSRSSVETTSTVDNNNVYAAQGQKSKSRSYQQRHRSHHGHGSHHRLLTSHRHHRQNVAIATQVISPSAIGGSLKLSGPRRLCQHYDPEADDDDSDGTGLFGRKKTLPWGKLSCYGASIGIVVLIMTGVVLAVGYMQSEKQRILSQSQKLSQEWGNTSGGIILIPTTWRPKIAYNIRRNITDPDTSASSSSTVTAKLPISSQMTSSRSSLNDTDTDFEVEEDKLHLELAKGEQISRNDEMVRTEDNTSSEDSAESAESAEDENDDDDEDVKELEIYEPRVNEERSPTQESRNSEQKPSEMARAVPRMDNNAQTQSLLLPLSLPIPSQSPLPLPINVDSPPFPQEEERHKSPSEVKVLPPKDFKFNGYSFEIPIYNANSSTPSSNAPKENHSSESTVVNRSNLPSFSVNEPIIPTKSTVTATENQDSASTIQVQTFDFKIVPFGINLNLDNLTSSTGINRDPHLHSPSFNFSNNLETQDSDKNPTSSSEDNFEALKKFLDSFNPTDTSDGAGNIQMDQLQKPSDTASGVNSFNTNSDIANLQADLFGDDNDDPNDGSPNSRNDTDEDNDNDSEMSASTNDKMRGRNTGPAKMKIQDDNMYTPRPGTNPHYPDRPSRVYSSKTSASYYSHPMDILYNSNKNDATDQNYNKNKSDFASFELTSTPVTTSTPLKPSTDSDKILSKSSSTPTFQPINVNSISDKSKQETTTISTLSVNDYQISSPPTTPITFNLHNYNINPVSTSPVSVTTDSSNFHFDFNQLTTPAPLHGATPTSTYPDVLSKRTFNFGYDSSSGYGGGGGSTSNFNTNNNYNSNPFSDILGSQSSVTGVIGSASPTGATLGYNGHFNFDRFNPYVNTGTGGSNSNSLFPSGTVPLDLASSYIQAGNNNQNFNSGGGSKSGGYNLQASGSNNYDFTSPYGSSPNSDPISLSQLIHNSANAGIKGAGGFPSHGSTTSGSNQAPEYNTITQGIHLLSLLHGNIPQHLVDNHASASNNYDQQAYHSGNPQYQIAALTGYGGSSNAFLNNLALSSHSTSSNFNYNPYLVSAESRLTTSGNDVSAGNSGGNNVADQQTSFSQNIVAKLADFSNINKKSVGDSVSAGSESIPTALTSAINSHHIKFSGGQERTDEKKLAKILDNISTPENSKSSAGKVQDMEAAASEILQISQENTDSSKNTILDKPMKPTINFAKKISTNKRRVQGETNTNERGLKSGFYF